MSLHRRESTPYPRIALCATATLLISSRRTGRAPSDVQKRCLPRRAAAGVRSGPGPEPGLTAGGTDLRPHQKPDSWRPSWLDSSPPGPNPPPGPGRRAPRPGKGTPGLPYARVPRTGSVGFSCSGSHTSASNAFMVPLAAAGASAPHGIPTPLIPGTCRSPGRIVFSSGAGDSP